MIDIGESALVTIFSTWDAKKSEITQFQNGFEWLPGNHVVHVQYQQNGGNPNRFRVSIVTDYLRSVPVHDKNFVRQAALMADFFCPTCAPVYRPLNVANGEPTSNLPDMHLCSSMYFDERTAEVLPTLLARISILQPVYAELQSTKVPEIFGGGVPAIADASRRPASNGAMSIAEDIIYPSGKQQTAWIGSTEFEQIATRRKDRNFCFVEADKRGMTVKAPFGSDSALVIFKTDEPHPHHGNGLLIKTEIDISRDLDEICANAANLNFLEASTWTDFPQLGCWTAEEISESKAGLTHTSFIPNSCFMPELVNVLADWALERVWWARTVLMPTESDLPASRVGTLYPFFPIDARPETKIIA